MYICVYIYLPTCSKRSQKNTHTPQSKDYPEINQQLNDNNNDHALIATIVITTPMK